MKGSCNSSDSGAELKLDVELDKLAIIFPLDFAGVFVLRINLTAPPSLIFLDDFPFSG